MWCQKWFRVFEDNDQALPFLTRSLIGVSEFCTSIWGRYVAGIYRPGGYVVCADSISWSKTHFSQYDPGYAGYSSTFQESQYSKNGPHPCHFDR